MTEPERTAAEQRIDGTERSPAGPGMVGPGTAVSADESVGAARPAPGGDGCDPVPGNPLLAEDGDKLRLRLQHAAIGFVDEPRAAVEEAASVLDELADTLAEAIARRRGALRASWQDTSGAAATEDLRIALRSYRQLADRLLKL
ncbi:hypothetical protein ACFYOD_01915 [Streptomyces sp. NPDC006703]|uniref:hypothetical protein n=1 Tax=Streptomyces sp. NPDC006703 TaxID=3364759 RepID=UPI00368AC036